MDRTHIIILNWNGGPDTWTCVQSVCMLPRVRITIVDNASTDDSVNVLRDRLTEAGISFAVLRDDVAAQLIDAAEPVAIVLSRENLSFAKGINLILRPLLAGSDTRYVWLLNNDAVADPGALSALVHALDSQAEAAFAGSVIMDGKCREEVQCFGVRYFKWLGVGKMLFKGRKFAQIEPASLNSSGADFQHGASLLVRMDAIRQIGLMDERFFLYSEEHDWQERARKAGYANIRVAGSKVFHLGSMSTERSKHLFFYYYSGSSVLFSRKHHKGVVAVTATLMLIAITMIRTRLHPKSMRWALKGILEAWQKPL